MRLVLTRAVEGGAVDGYTGRTIAARSGGGMILARSGDRDGSAPNRGGGLILGHIGGGDIAATCVGCHLAA